MDLKDHINCTKTIEPFVIKNNTFDFITFLPREISLKIFSFFNPQTLTTCSLVNKTWYTLCKDPWLYHKLLKQSPWGTLSHSQSSAGFNSNCYKCLSKEFQCFNREGSVRISHQRWAKKSMINWYEEYKRQYQYHRNWLEGRYKHRIFTGHTSVVHCVVFDDQRIISGSADKTIKVWNLHTNAQWTVQTLLGHSEAVRCLQLLQCIESPMRMTRDPLIINDNNNGKEFIGQKYPRDIQLVSGSNDKTIKIWDLTSRNDWSSIVCQVTLTGHTDFVRCLQADHNKIVSGSYDCTLKIWSLETATLIRTLVGHKDSILCVQYDDNVIVSGSLDKTIKVWSFGGDCLCTLWGHADPVACLHLDFKNNRIISGSHDNTLKFWDISTQDCVRSIDWMESEGHKRVVRCLQADHYRFVSGSDDKTIKVWDIETGERLRTYQGHIDGVSCLQFNNEMLVSGSYDHTVILWDFSAC